jgi:hypothetical protein
MGAALKLPERLDAEETMPMMRLVADDGPERRVFPRKEVHARVEGRRLDHSITARQMPHLSLNLRDLSMGGLSALSQTPLEKGERIAVYFPPQGPNRGWDACGRVIRVQESVVGYRIAVEFDALPMAA